MGIKKGISGRKCLRTNQCGYGRFFQSIMRFLIEVRFFLRFTLLTVMNLNDDNYTLWNGLIYQNEIMPLY